jgi:rhodanese-related sulfurtransferase
MNLKSTFVCACAVFTLLAAGIWLASDMDIFEQQEAAIKSLSVATLNEAQLAKLKIIYIDTREKEEYDEGHIPGAWNIPLRNVSRLTKQQLALLHNADIVVPYCIKDFRGYEVARELHELGVSQVMLIDGFGLAAWKQHGGKIDL